MTVGWQEEVVAAHQADLVDEFLCVFADPSCGFE